MTRVVFSWFRSGHEKMTCSNTSDADTTGGIRVVTVPRSTRFEQVTIKVTEYLITAKLKDNSNEP